MFEGWQYFHFLRPCWLLGILAAPLLYFITQKRLGADYQWRNIIAPHLLEHLKVRPAASAKFRPIHLISLFIILAALALAGPAWQREPSPFSEDKAPLVIALDLSQTMDAVDIAPTRLERAKLKITDLLQLRQGARTALLVYAGSAHTVLPFTDDPALLNMYIESLSTHIMPSKGKAPQKALELAASLLDKSEIPGTLLFFTDGIAGKYAAQFTRYMQTSRNQIAVLAFGTREGGPIQTGKNRFLTKNGRRVMAPFDYEGLHTLSQKADIPVIGSTVDDNDVERLQRSIQTHLQAALAEDESLRWRDNGYYLLFPIVLLAALWFRKGWTLQWRA